MVEVRNRWKDVCLVCPKCLFYFFKQTAQTVMIIIISQVFPHPFESTSEICPKMSLTLMMSLSTDCLHYFRFPWILNITTKQMATQRRIWYFNGRKEIRYNWFPIFTFRDLPSSMLTRNIVPGMCTVVFVMKSWLMSRVSLSFVKIYRFRRYNPLLLFFSSEIYVERLNYVISSFSLLSLS